jgi:7-cyano-7-deazaguanine reductase
MPSRPSRQLVTFDNPNPERDYLIRHECPEYTALCPVTGQPDFGTIVVIYVPDRKCIELKSLKLYLWSFRNEGHFFEAVTNRILTDLVAAVRPRRMTVIGRFNVRGGITSQVVARHPDGRGGRRTRGPLPARARSARGRVARVRGTGAVRRRRRA